MKMNRLNNNCYYFSSSVNVGYVHEGNNGLIIDAAIDQSAIRKVVRQLEEAELPITHLFITHAHADHYGGAAYLKKHYDVKVMAPKLEAAIVENPIIEPIYMFQGNTPVEELRNKFLEGPPVEVDLIVDEGEQNIDGFNIEFIATPGHSYHQFALATKGILYAADSYFGKKELNKHKIPYITCAKDTIESLEKIKDKVYDGAVPGHGPYEEDFKSTIQYNIEYHQNILSSVKEMLDRSAHGLSHEDIVSFMCARHDVKADQLSMFMLFRTAVSAYVRALVEDNKAKFEIENFRVMIKPV
ncbi:MBL fold metallo-hydrolase [Alkalibacillus haloalkaliphilus]|uniref:MBL fold metallo-hydrolase n=1 Tax=Alkalibacillus haloalkaliphilus TaxID=94136 RepID=A0A511W8E0_9BACI|nr:MBL fold metallo-hydrolase [Alkalibacillus haloalkaliphilus]GEN45622.1 MBL fold metallo-hydrolase [Alkalibacillus haloalkaliphilus]